MESSLGILMKGETATIRLFDEQFHLSDKGITDTGGKRPSFEKCVVIFKYIIHHKGLFQESNDWLSYRDLRDTGPLLSYFKNEVEGSFARFFSGRLQELNDACHELRGIPVGADVASGDVRIQFKALPRIPLLLLFYERDDEFPASSSVLFKSDAEHFLDAECLAILGGLLFLRLQEIASYL